jgi:hypothetical protein
MLDVHFTYEHEDSIPVDFKCPLCSKPFVDPVDVACCRTTYCSQCISDATPPVCPQCQADSFSTVASSRLVRNAVDLLMVRCRGCRHVMQRNHYDKHAKERCSASNAVEALPFVVAHQREEIEALRAELQLLQSQVAVIEVLKLHKFLMVKPNTPPPYASKQGRVVRLYGQIDRSGELNARLDPVRKPIVFCTLPESFAPTHRTLLHIKVLPLGYQGIPALTVEPDGRIMMSERMLPKSGSLWRFKLSGAYYFCC